MHSADKRAHTHTQHTHTAYTHTAAYGCAPWRGPCGNSNTKRSHVALTLIYKHSSFICHNASLPHGCLPHSPSLSLSRLLESTSQRASSHVHRKTQRKKRERRRIPQLFASLFAALLCPVRAQLARLVFCYLRPSRPSQAQ